MATNQPHPLESFRNPGYELFMVGLSVLSIANIVLVLGPFAEPTKQVANIVDNFLCAIFLVDFLDRLRRSRPRSEYFIGAFGWADLIGSFPAPGFRLFRLLHAGQVVRLLGRLGGHKVVRSFIRRRAESALLIVLFLVLVVLELGSILVLWAESASPDANIVSGEDALWWAIVSVSTVGYGDFYPVTSLGRLFATALLVTGVALIAVITGYLANLFVTPRAEDRGPDLEFGIGSGGVIEMPARADTPRTLGPAEGGS